MNTFQLTCFIAVANTLSFARAAENLHVTQPAVTHQIKVLEQELGVPLLHRSTRSVTLTPEGQTFLEDAKSADLPSRAMISARCCALAAAVLP